jgi:hypothetical protein
MADYALNIPNETMAAAFQNIYSKIPRQTITPTAISLAEKNRSTVAAEADASLRPYLDLSATQREQAAVQSRAELDADAYSRGMGSSTWLTDKKSRESMAAQTDIANMKAQYAASIADSINKSMANYETNKLAVDQANVSNKLAADQFNASQEEQAYTKAYQILMDMWNKGLFATPTTGSGSGGGDGDGITPKSIMDQVNANNDTVSAAIALARALGGSSKTSSDMSGAWASAKAINNITKQNVIAARALANIG